MLSEYTVYSTIIIVDVLYIVFFNMCMEQTIEQYLAEIDLAIVQVENETEARYLAGMRYLKAKEDKSRFRMAGKISTSSTSFPWTSKK